LLLLLAARRNFVHIAMTVYHSCCLPTGRSFFLIGNMEKTIEKLYLSLNKLWDASVPKIEEPTELQANTAHV
jgi:hypothetical protein